MKKRICYKIAQGGVILGAVVYLFPLWWAILSSFKPLERLVTLPPTIIFKPTLKGYTTMLLKKGFLQYLINSSIICSTSTIIALAIGALAAYSLARFQIRGKQHIAFWILSTKMLPPVAVVIPFYIIFKTLRLIDTYLVLILLYTLMNLPLTVWIMRSFFECIPQSVEEAAMIDGCSRLSVIFRITLPLSTPGIGTSAFFCVVFAWNELLYALVLTSMNAKTLAVGAAGVIEMRRLLWNEVGVVTTIMAIPVLVFIMIFRKYMISGLTFGAVTAE